MHVGFISYTFHRVLHLVEFLLIPNLHGTHLVSSSNWWTTLTTEAGETAATGTYCIQ